MGSFVEDRAKNAHQLLFSIKEKRMKKLATLLLTAGMLFGAATGASAIDFKAKGEWIMGFGVADTMFYGQGGGDNFQALQRIRLQIDAVASEFLSGTVHFEIGDQYYGHQSGGGALGTDGIAVKVKHAYIDWVVPNTELKLRMGLQWFQNPEVAGGPAVLGSDGAGIVANYTFNDSVGLTAAWMRPYNDNYVNYSNDYEDRSNFLDNFDLFMLSLPIKGDGWRVTPWAMVGMLGENVHGDAFSDTVTYGKSKPLFREGLSALEGYGRHMSHQDPYQSMFWVGLPMSFRYNAFNFELDINYGATSYGGTYTLAAQDGTGYGPMRIDDQRSGFVIKALAEYKLSWGTPSLMFWYGSGDDGDLKNGSERMPVVAPDAWFTSFVADSAWSIADANWANPGYDLNLDFTGTWGLALGLSNVSFMDKLSHTFKIAYWQGTNDPKNAKYLDSRRALAPSGLSTFYLTQNDYIVEFNLDSTYQLYKNLSATLQLGYIINGVDEDTWNHTNSNDWEKRDGYKAALIFKYKF